MVAGIRELAAEMSRGEVKTLVIAGGNPAFTAPADLQFEANLKKVPVSIAVGLEDDETAGAVRWHVPEAHLLESWGDAAGASTARLPSLQPLIEPLYGGKTRGRSDRARIGLQGSARLRHRSELLDGAVSLHQKEKTWREVAARRRHRGNEGARGEGPSRRQAGRRGRGKCASVTAGHRNRIFRRVLRCGTAASPTTAGCRKRRTR